jgi:hypothetical protein
MSENSPRWPGSNGAPGLDFSPYRKPADEARGGSVAAPPAPPVDAPVAPVGKGSSSADQATQAWSAAPVTEAPVTGTPIPPPEAPAEVPVPARKPRASHRTRKARLRLARIDPWSVMKTTFLFSIAFGVMMVVATFALWSVLAGSGALESLNTLINTLISSEQEGASFKIEDYLGVQRILGFSVVVAAIDVVIITAVATLFAFLYNLSAVVMGGLEVTLAED